MESGGESEYRFVNRDWLAQFLSGTNKAAASTTSNGRDSSQESERLEASEKMEDGEGQEQVATGADHMDTKEDGEDDWSKDAEVYSQPSQAAEEAGDETEDEAKEAELLARKAMDAEREDEKQSAGGEEGSDLESKMAKLWPGPLIESLQKLLCR